MNILWANMHCLLDSSSGASLSARQILANLSERGHDVRILGSTVFDHANGTSFLGDYWTNNISKRDSNEFIEIIDGKLTHILHKTNSVSSDDMTRSEISAWTTRYRNELRYFKPEFMFFYGGGPGDFIPAEAQSSGVVVGAYLVNGSFHTERWCRDVDVFITDTHATRDLYRERLNIDPFVAGKFIEAEKIAKSREPKKLLYVNPSLSKGAGVLVMLARVLQRIAPDIEIEVVESRGSWEEILGAINETLGEPRGQVPPNVAITKNTRDMASVYSRARMLFVPSLWYESGARVIAEAQLNGIPVVATDSGGNKEMVGNGGVIFQLAASCFRKPYLDIPTEASLAELGDWIVKLFRDNDFYNQISGKALSHARKKHNATKNTELLEQYIQSYVDQKRPWSATKIKQVVHQPYDLSRTNSYLDIYCPLGPGQRGLFIDGGGYDGCSSFKFISNNPQFDCITFEPNSMFWDYYKEAPSHLLKMGVAAENGEKTFIVDSVDGDGSSFIKDKKIDYHGKHSNDELGSETWKCLDISGLVAHASKKYDSVVLKLDVEGAEYEVLEKLDQNSLLQHIDRLYIEWHWEKCGFDKAYHDRLVARIKEYCDIFHWDALDFSIHTRGEEVRETRNALLKLAIGDRLPKYQELKLGRKFLYKPIFLK